ncbi:MAG: SNF2-related protein [Cyanobium sp.]
MGATSTSPRLKPGSVVRCRTRRYLVEDVQPPMHRKLPEGGDRVVTLACMEDDAIGQRITVFLGSEVDFEPLAESSWEAVTQRGFDQPRQFSAYLNTLRWNCVTATDAELFQAPYRAGIDVKAYQLEPLRKALLMPRVGLFIADDVGLGKTIEAGLILREMLLRQRIRRVVISCPPSVLRQWQEEMASRFGLAFTVMDRAYVARVRQERGYGTNPWSTGSRFLISQALLHNPDYANPLLSWLDQGRGDEDQAPLPSLLILDEAHNAAPASNSLRYAIDSPKARANRKEETIRELNKGMSAKQIKTIRTELAAGPKGIRPFHWELEFPEVFQEGRGGFDAFVGNPPPRSRAKTPSPRAARPASTTGSNSCTPKATATHWSSP